MSFFPAQDPAPGDALRCDAIAHVIVPRGTDLGGFRVHRALPSAQRRMVGPFIFLDHMGPAEFRAGQGVDVRPHPHIGLATVTYLYAGEIVHRDSLGTLIPIRAAISPIVAASVWLNRFPRAIGLLRYDDELGRRSDERANI